MPDNQQFEYENEFFIDAELICAICLCPFNKPKLTPCQHMFCHDCICLWFTKRLSCPICRQVSEKRHLKSMNNQHILNKLDQLKVKCSLCEQTGIKREDFDYHIHKKCPKVIVSCSVSAIKCAWKGCRADLQRHRTICSSNRHILVLQHKQNKVDLRSLASHRLNIEDLINQYSLHAKISLRDKQLTDIDIPLVIESAITNKKCKILDLGNNQIMSHGVSLLADSLQNNNTLKILSLHQNSVTELGIRSLGEKLALNNSALKWLDLESTDLTDDSVRYLAEMLKTNKSVTGLWLSNNRIGYRGVRMLATALMDYNTTLTCLDLENNPSINDSSIDSLVEMLQYNQSLKKIYLVNCPLSMTNKNKLRAIANTKQNFRLFL